MWWPAMDASPESNERRPAIASTSSVCPLPWTPAMTTISPARTSRSTPSTAISRRSSRTCAPRRLSTTSPGLAGPLGTISSTSRPTIRLASSWRVAALGSAAPATRPRRRTTTSSATSRTSLSLWVMKMIVVPVAVRDRMIPNSSSVSNGREHGAGLVEHEDVALAVEGLEDLDPLADADRQVLDPRVRVDAELVLLGQVDDPLACRRAIEAAEAVADGLRAEGDRLDDVEHRDQHEVLVDHPDAGLDGGRGVLEDPLLPVDDDLARVRPVQPGQDVHQGGLARAVLAEQSEHLAAVGRDRDRVVREDARKPLRDVAQFEPHQSDLEGMEIAPGPRRGPGAVVEIEERS